MSNQILVTVIEGNLTGQQFTFAERTTCSIGRAHDANIKLPDDEAHRTISRYHCLLDINPPDVRVRDFGSLNGTYLTIKRSDSESLIKPQKKQLKSSFLNTICKLVTKLN
jgi:pSer/pThr/pTyr-binding forkhead associated (FHA) protein